jgi:outer membrane protein TolC
MSRTRAPRDARTPSWMRPLHIASLLAATACVAACATQPRYQKPAIEVQSAWANAPAGATVALPKVPAEESWWTQLNDPAIDTLVAAGLTDSPTLAQAAARVDEARATLNVSRAQRLPQLTGNASAARGTTQNTQTPGSASTFRSDSASVGASLGWELDLWGRARSTQDAAHSRLDARNADANGARLSLAAQIADGVLNLRACNYSLAVRDQDIASRETELALMRQRLAAGNVAEVDEANASGNLASARTNRISQQEQCVLIIDALVALSGQDASTIRSLAAQPLAATQAAAADGVPPLPITAADGAPPLPITQASAASVMPSAPLAQPALPASVLRAHPSVQSAEREVAASWSEIGVARAERLPRVDLSALLTGQWLRAFGSTVHFDTWSAGPALSVPLFDGGSGAATVRGAEARYRNALATLRSTLRTAAQDVEDALAVQQSAEQRISTSQQAVDAGRVALRANEARYRAGAISAFELEDARRQFNSAQESAIAAARDRAQAWVDLVRASGNALAPSLTGQNTAPVDSPISLANDSTSPR